CHHEEVAVMLELLLIIVGCYALAALMVHLSYWFGCADRHATKHYVLIADHSQNNIEWYLRSLMSFSRRMGRNVQMTVLDRDASEETKAIVERWSRSEKGVKVHPEPKKSKDISSDSKRSQSEQFQATQLMWILHAEGIVSEADHA